MGYAGVKGVTPRMVAVAAARLVGGPEILTLAALGALFALAAGPGRRVGLRAFLPGLALAVLVVAAQALVYASIRSVNPVRDGGAVGW